jgi:hypothetical protein
MINTMVFTHPSNILLALVPAPDLTIAIVLLWWRARAVADGCADSARPRWRWWRPKSDRPLPASPRYRRPRLSALLISIT